MRCHMIIAGGGLRCGRQHAVEIGDDLHVCVGREIEREREVEKAVGEGGREGGERIESIVDMIMRDLHHRLADKSLS